MIFITNECRACDSPSCLGCGWDHVTHYACDLCGEEVEDEFSLYRFGNDSVCKDCLEKLESEE